MGDKEKKDKKEKKEGKAKKGGEEKKSSKAKGSGDDEKKLKRVEIIYSAAVDEDFVEGFKKNNIGKRFTKIAGVTGAGFSNPKLGDSVWPQLNQMAIVYCSKEEAEKIVDLIKDLREKYPLEGIACFVSKAAVR